MGNCVKRETGLEIDDDDDSEKPREMEEIRKTLVRKFFNHSR
jgi:hypothetical protein